MIKDEPVITEKQFWATLKKLAGTFTIKAGRIRQRDEPCACPICAVANEVFQRPTRKLSGAWGEAVRRLGLHQLFPLMRIIANAADTNSANSLLATKMRRKLLRTLGLKEPKS